MVDSRMVGERIRTKNMWCLTELSQAQHVLPRETTLSLPPHTVTSKALDELSQQAFPLTTASEIV